MDARESDLRVSMLPLRRADMSYVWKLLDSERARADALIAKHGSCEDAYEELRALARELAAALCDSEDNLIGVTSVRDVLARAREAGLLKEGT